jgi:hypothetical protein
MELVITTVVLITAMATVELPNCREPKSELVPIRKKQSRRAK